MRVLKVLARRSEGMEPIRGELGEREALRRLLGYLKPMRGDLIIGLVLVSVQVLANLAYGKFAANFVRVLERADPSTTAAELQALNTAATIAMGVYVSIRVLDFLTQFVWSRIAQMLSRRMRLEVFSHLQRQSISFFDSRQTGQLLSVIGSDIPSLNVGLTAVRDMVSAPLTLLIGGGILIYLSWKLTLVAAFCLPIGYFLIRGLRKFLKKNTKTNQRRRAALMDLVHETLANMRLIRAFGNEEHHARRYERKSNAILTIGLQSSRIRIAASELVDALSMLSLLMVLYFAGGEIITGKDGFRFSTLTWYLMVLQHLFGAAQNLGRTSLQLATVGVSADRIFTLLNQKPEVVESANAAPLRVTEGRVEFRNVTFGYPNRPAVVQDFSLTLAPGQVVAVVGPTGAGKSTLASLLLRLYDPQSGEICIDGQNLQDCSFASLRSQMAIVPQDTQLFSGSLRENIAYGRLGASDEELIAAAKQANAWEFIERLPGGLATHVGERGVQLSGGQRQRIAIARAILRDPRILILDEATSSLDAQSEAVVQEALTRLVSHRTTLIIAHRLTTVRDADRIVVLDQGRIAESGRHEELLAADGVYAALYRRRDAFTEPEA